MPNYTVQQGDCISSIAKKFNVGDWSVIFNHPKNAALKQKRKTPNVLFPGDVVFIPEPEPKEEAKPAGKSHKFQVRTPKKLISIIVEDHEDRVLADTDYTLIVGGETIKGKTDGKGKLETRVPVDAQDGQLTVGKFTWTLQIGHLNPIEHAPDDGSSGLMQRLRNLGYSIAEGIEAEEEKAKAAIAAFQARHSLPVSGQLDDATKKKLTTRHEEGGPKGKHEPPKKPADAPKPKDAKPRDDKPPAGDTEGYYEKAKHQLSTFYDWLDDAFKHDSDSGHQTDKTGVKKEAPVAPSVKDSPTPNVLSAACNCFVCTLKLTAARQSYDNMKAAHEKIASAAAPPAKAEDMLKWFHDDPFQMNIIGIRRRHSFTNKFDDTIVSFFRVGADTGKDEWKPIADKYGLKSQDDVVQKASFVPCKRFGGFWVGVYDVSTDPGWETNKDSTDISFATLDAGEVSPEDNHCLRSGEAFVCPGWYKATWRVGAHHKNARGGHLALVQAKDALIERLNYPKLQVKPKAVTWLRVYKDGKDPVDYGDAVYHIATKPPLQGAKATVELGEKDVIGERYYYNGGFNIHRGHHHPAQSGANNNTQVGFGQGSGTAYSEGCQVFAQSVQFDQFLRQCLFTKWWQCKDKSCKRITSADAFKQMGFFETVEKAGSSTYKQLACYEYDHVSSCDDGECGIRYDYVLIELTAKDLDKLKADFKGLDNSFTFKNGNKLFVGGAAPAAGSGSSSSTSSGSSTTTTPSVASTPPVGGQTHTCGSTNDPLYRAPKVTSVSAEEMHTAVARAWKELVGKGKSDDLVDEVAMVLVGQWGVETGWGKKMMNFNFGNVKRGSAQILFTAFSTSEYYKDEAGALKAADCPIHSRTLGHNLNKGWGAAFDPPHKQTYFRAYETLDDGVKAHFAVLQKQSNFVAAWNALVAHANGTADSAGEKERHDRLHEAGLAFGAALKAGHYATAADYDEMMATMAISVWRRIKAAEYSAWKAAHPTKKAVIGS